MTVNVFKGASSAAFYSDIDCRSGCDVDDSFGLFQTYAVVAGRYFDRSDGLDGKAYAHIGWRNRTISHNPSNAVLFRVVIC